MVATKPMPTKIFVGEGSTVWRVPLEGKGTYDVTTYPDSQLVMVQIAGTSRRISETQGRKLIPVLRLRIAEAIVDEATASVGNI